MTITDSVIRLHAAEAHMAAEADAMEARLGGLDVTIAEARAVVRRMPGALPSLPPATDPGTRTSRRRAARAPLPRPIPAH